MTAWTSMPAERHTARSTSPSTIVNSHPEARPSRGPSERQIAFLSSLADRKMPAADVPGFLAALRSTSWTSSSVSTAIDSLLTYPDYAGPDAAPAPARANRFSAPCRRCGQDVPAQTGSLLKVDGAWAVEHVECPDREIAAQVDGCSMPAEFGPPIVSALPDVPQGHYAYPSSGSNDLSFVRVDRPTDGRWAGRTFVKQVIGGHPDQPIARANVASVLASIVEFGVDKAATLYGVEIGRCYVCNRHLTDETSRSLGIGPDCRSRS